MLMPADSPERPIATGVRHVPLATRRNSTQVHRVHTMAPMAAVPLAMTRSCCASNGDFSAHTRRGWMRSGMPVAIVLDVIALFCLHNGVGFFLESPKIQRPYVPERMFAINEVAMCCRPSSESRRLGNGDLGALDRGRPRLSGLRGGPVYGHFFACFADRRAIWSSGSRTSLRPPPGP
jgi:hypothetical protein